MDGDHEHETAAINGAVEVDYKTVTVDVIDQN